MIIKKVIDFDMDQNCYIVSEDGENCIVIDPGCGYEKIVKELKESSFTVLKILLTHCHYDHMAGAERLKKATGAKIVSGKNCRENIKNTIINVSKMFGDELVGADVDEVVSDNEKFEIGGMKIKCIETPGHTDCSVCYLIEDCLFTGDTLFLRTTGRWDLPTGNYEMLENSLKEKLYKLDDDIKVYPGHGNPTSIGYEKKFNMSISE